MKTKEELNELKIEYAVVKGILQSNPIECITICRKNSRQPAHKTAEQQIYSIEKYWRECGEKVKATHALRRTFGSELAADGATSLECSKVLGNTPEVFERYYLFNTKSADETRAHINKMTLRGKAV